MDLRFDAARNMYCQGKAAPSYTFDILLRAESNHLISCSGDLTMRTIARALGSFCLFVAEKLTSLTPPAKRKNGIVSHWNASLFCMADAITHGGLLMHIQLCFRLEPPGCLQFSSEMETKINCSVIRLSWGWCQAQRKTL